MYLRYFGLIEAPFSITPDPAFVFLSPLHRDALAHLLYGIGRGGSGGFVQLTGEVGTGKTTLCRCMLEQVPDGTHIALLLNPLITPLELLAAISEEFAIDVTGTADSTRLLVDRLNRYLLEVHARGERAVVVIDEAQNLSPEALEQVRLLTNLETSKEKLLQIVLLGQPELRELLQRQSLRQLAQRITARYHLSPLGPQDTQLYVHHRLQVAGAQRNPFRRSAMKALYQRSQGIPRLINIIADRALLSAFSTERLEVNASMVHEAANEVQLGERQVKRRRWPWLVAAMVVLVLAAFTVRFIPDTEVQPVPEPAQGEHLALRPAIPEQDAPLIVQQPVETVAEEYDTRQSVAGTLDPAWLEAHQGVTWQGLAEAWGDTGAAEMIQTACDGNDSLGYVCLKAQGSWSKIKRLGLPTVLVLQGQVPSYLLLLGMDEGRLLVGVPQDRRTVSRSAVESRWLGSYLVAWPQSAGWPGEVSRGDSGPAVATLMEMAALDEVPYHGGQVFDANFENWLKNFQMRNGLEADGIVGRITLLHLMTTSIEEPRLLSNWEY